MINMNTVQLLPTASRKICAGAATVPVAAWNPATAFEYPSAPCTAYQTPRSRIHPKITDTTTDFQIPFGPETSASWVSSVMCADASYPVSVYCASSMPIRKTYSVVEKNPVENPVPLMNPAGKDVQSSGAAHLKLKIVPQLVC